MPPLSQFDADMLNVLRDNESLAQELESKRCCIVMYEADIARLREEVANLREVNAILKADFERLALCVDQNRLAKYPNQ